MTDELFERGLHVRREVLGGLPAGRQAFTAAHAALKGAGALP